MDFNEYSKQARTTAMYKGAGSYRGVTYCVLGLAGEAGEVAGKFSKCNRDDDDTITPERREQLLDELGDTLWFADRLSEELHSSLEEVAKRNLAKLADRKDRGHIQGSGDVR